MSQAKNHARGVSLIEALVALAVMAFGMLGVVGMQVSLRANADSAKQRAEAVRIAQAAMEDWRVFEQLPAPPTGGTALSFEGIVAYNDRIASGYTTNTSYSVDGAVTPETVSAGSLKLKSVKVDVAWTDRAGQTQTVSLASGIAGVAPELAASLALPGDRTASQRPRGRNSNIPISATESGNGTSTFVPPGTSNVTWIFNNLTGVFKVCNPECSGENYLLLTGFVRFATDSAPSPALSENPASTPQAVAVAVTLTLPVATSINCASEIVSGATAYYCAIPARLETAEATDPLRWSGRANLVDGIGITLATSASDATASSRRVCRYTPALTDTPAGGNQAHPLNYSEVGFDLSNQNFLVIKAGDGTSAYACPTDDTSTPLVNGNTYRHQPLT